jgi:dihydroneopterin aldolase
MKDESLTYEEAESLVRSIFKSDTVSLVELVFTQEQAQCKIEARALLRENQWIGEVEVVLRAPSSSIHGNYPQVSSKRVL